MNKKIVTGSLTIGILYGFVFAGTASAFWPFDGLFKKEGEVKAVATDKMYRPIIDDRANKLGTALKSMTAICDDLYTTANSTTPKSGTRIGEVDPTTGTITTAQNGNSGVVSPNREADGGKKIKPETKPAPMNKEMEAVYTALKARCENIRSLQTRFLKVYKPTITPTVQVTAKPTPQVRGPFNFFIRDDAKD